MIRVLTPPAGRPAPRLSGLAAALALVVAVAACGGKTETQLANDALNAGIAAHTSGNIEEAKKQYNECLKHDPTNKVCHYDLGLIAQTAGDATTAENEYRLSLSADPNYTPALFNLAILRAGLNDTTEAIALYRRYVAILPDDAGGHLNLGLLLIAIGDKINGDKEIARAIQLDPKISVPQSSPAPTQSVTPSEGPSQTPKPSPSG
jgi:tetratricopeptide (TPR) repeat protein